MTSSEVMPDTAMMKDAAQTLSWVTMAALGRPVPQGHINRVTVGPVLQALVYHTPEGAAFCLAESRSSSKILDYRKIKKIATTFSGINDTLKIPAVPQNEEVC